MPFLDRLTRALGADLHALLDRVEDPDTLLRQALRDMEAELDRLAGEARRLEAALAEVRRAHDADEARRSELDRSLDLCLAEGREDLARTVVRDKLALDAQLRARKARAEALAGTLAEAREQLSVRRAEWTELKAEADRRTDAETLRSAPSARAEPSAPAGTIRDSDVEIALLAEIAARRRS